MPFFRRKAEQVVPEEPAPVGPPDRDEIARRVVAAAPTVGPAIVDSLQPTVRFASRREPDAAMDICQSKVGGAPDLPSGTHWPSWTDRAGERHPLQFFAQINLTAATEAAPGALGLPTQGHLSFFADLDGPEHASTVLYSRPDAQFVRCSPRMLPLPSGELHPIGTWTWPARPPDHNGLQGNELASLDAVEASLEADLRAAAPERWQVLGRHQLGGHIRVLGLAMELALAGDWRLLLQLDSDEGLELTFPAGGTVCWAAEPDDIAAGQWDRGLFRFQ